MKFWRLHRLGYRVLKTVIATTLTLLVCSRFSKMSPVLALMGAYCAMGRTIRESWTGCLNQMVGVLVGSVFGFLLLHVLPDPPALVIGLSLFAVIGLCNLLHVSYAVFLSSVIFISVCSGASQLPDILARVRDVSIGLAFGLAVNIFVHPYANERQVLALLEKLREESLRALREITSFGRYPDLSACAHLREKLDFELDQMRQQAALLKTRRSRRSLAWQTGCAQLAGRMVQEVTALGMMDSFGRVSEETIGYPGFCAGDIFAGKLFAGPSGGQCTGHRDELPYRLLLSGVCISDTAAAALEGRRTRAGGEAGRGDKQ